MHISPRWTHYFVLGSSVWLIYTLDHLLDAYRKPVLLSSRHQFHKQHRSTLLLICAALLFPTAWLAFTRLPLSVIRFGVALGVLLIAYLSVTHFFKLPYFFKEGWVALLYTVGVWGGMAVQARSLRLTDWLAGGAFGVIILQQAMLLSWYETDEDAHQYMASLMQQQSAAPLHLFLKVLSLANVLATGLGFAFHNYTIFDLFSWGTLLVIALVLAVITHFPAVFRPHYAYRLLSDGILMLPLWLMIAFPS